MNIITAMFFIGCDIFISGLLVTNTLKGIALEWRLSLLLRLAAQSFTFVSIVFSEGTLVAVLLAVSIILTIVNALDYLLFIKNPDKVRAKG
jgi:CBS domain containing-hemolysin-like protein